MNSIDHVKYAIRTLPDLGESLKNLVKSLEEELKILSGGDTNGNFDNFKTKLDELGLKVEIIAQKLNLSHMVEGLAGELGEIVNCTGTELKLKIDKVNLLEELGDLYWYTSCYCHLRNVPVPNANTLSVGLSNDMCFEHLICSISDLVDLVKRFTAYNKEVDRAKELQVVYDIYIALYLFEQAYELDGDKIRENNIAKLRKRYPEKYSDDLAINRNTDEERKALES